MVIKNLLIFIVNCVIIAEDVNKPMMFDSRPKSGYVDVILKIKPPTVILDNSGKVSTRASISSMGDGKR